ncbi:MAG: hypothetical protein LBO08_00110 [Rickettsiales bacterium]|nr:hypothetical protein [Rickettsiales bacterium]
MTANEFLTAWFLNNSRGKMPIDVQARLADWNKRGQLPPKYKNIYSNAPAPDFDDLSYDDQTELYYTLQKILRNIYEDKRALDEGGPVLKFVFAGAFAGPGKLFGEGSYDFRGVSGDFARYIRDLIPAVSDEIKYALGTADLTAVINEIANPDKLVLKETQNNLNQILNAVSQRAQQIQQYKDEIDNIDAQIRTNSDIINDHGDELQVLQDEIDANNLKINSGSPLFGANGNVISGISDAEKQRLQQRNAELESEKARVPNGSLEKDSNTRLVVNKTRMENMVRGLQPGGGTVFPGAIDMQRIIADIKAKLSTDISAQTQTPDMAEFAKELPKILGLIASNDKVRDAVFKQTDQLTYKAISEGIVKIDDIAPLQKKKLFARAKTGVKNFGQQTFGRFFSKGERKNLPDNARGIYKAVKATKFDGKSMSLPTIVGKADDIKKTLSIDYPGAGVQYDWMMKNLKTVMADGQFNRALSDAQQMDKLVNKLNEIAARDGSKAAMDGAKNAQFVLNSLTGGLLDSGMIGDANKLDFNGLSKHAWLNNTMKYGTVGLATGISLAGRLITKNNNRKMFGLNKSHNSLKEIQKADAQVRRSGAGADYYERQEQAARKAYEDAFKAGKKSAKLEKKWHDANLLTEAAKRRESMDGGMGANRDKTYLDNLLELQAHYKLVRSQKTTSILSLKNHNRVEHNYFSGKYNSDMANMQTDMLESYGLD